MATALIRAPFGIPTGGNQITLYNVVPINYPVVIPFAGVRNHHYYVSKWIQCTSVRNHH